MKKSVLVVISAILMASFSAQAADLRLATVSMERLFENYYKSQEGMKKIQSAAERAQEQASVYVSEGQALVDARNSLIEQLENPALSDEAKNDIRGRVVAKEREIQQKQTDIQQWQRDTSNSLQQRQMQFRQEIIDELRAAVKSHAESLGRNLVIDTSDVVGAGVPTVLLADPSWDITEAVLTKLNATKP